MFGFALTFSSKTERWSIVTPVTQWDLVQPEPKLRDKWPNCQVAALHCIVLHKLCCHLRWHKQLSLNRENVKTENKSPPLSCLHNPQICLLTDNKLESNFGSAEIFLTHFSLNDAKSVLMRIPAAHFSTKIPCCRGGGYGSPEKWNAQYCFLPLWPSTGHQNYTKM